MSPSGIITTNHYTHKGEREREREILKHHQLVVTSETLRQRIQHVFPIVNNNTRLEFVKTSFFKVGFIVERKMLEQL